MRGCAARGSAIGPRCAGVRPVVVGWQWHSAARQPASPGFAVSVGAAVGLAAGAVGSVVEVAAVGPTVGCAVGGQPEMRKMII